MTAPPRRFSIPLTVCGAGLGCVCTSLKTWEPFYFLNRTRNKWFNYEEIHTIMEHGMR